MSTKTHIPGKDAALEDTLERATTLLHSHGFPVALASWRNPVQGCWSVHLRSTQCPQLYTNGKGASKLASEVSAILEFFERVSTNLFFADYYLGDESADGSDFVFFPQEKWFPVEDATQIPTHAPDGTPLLNAKLLDFYNPAGELTPALLHDNNSDNRARGISALPFEQLETKETVYFPVSVLNNIYVSNGMAAGNTPTECCAQALAEILERYVKNTVIAEGIALPNVPQKVIDRYAHIQEGIAELRAHGFTILVKDASLGGKFPVVCVLLVNPDNGGCYASFGASCRFEVALERTVTELLQGRELDELNVFQPPCHDTDTVADALNLESHFINSDGLLSWRMFRDAPDFAFDDWDFAGSSADEYARLKAIIRDLGYEAYCADYAHCGIYTCRILVPGMSEIYPVDDLVWDNKTSAVALRPQLLRLGQMSKDALSKLLEELDEIGLSDEQPISDAIGVLFDEGSAWCSLRVGELKAMITLATGQLKEAAHWCRWCESFGFLPAPRQKLYRAIIDLVDFGLSDGEASDYHGSLKGFFGEELLATAEAIVSGKLTFHGLNFAKTWEEISPAHGNLLSVYRRLQLLK
ncbi:MAG: YcaO-like family protein [Deltaproteobacteria bacterium]|nr:YcaO-like family protein [Deltaproteobacteria bacterium]